jgi:hypothetical protein
MNDAGAAVSRIDFTNGPLRGTHLILYAACLVHRGDAHLETVPLATVAAVRVEFLRDQRRIGWGIALIVLALLLFAIAGPLVSLAVLGAGDVASGTSGVANALHTLFQILEAIGHALPWLGAVGLLGGGTLAAVGWLGSTTLTLTFAGGERSYLLRGRNAKLLDFAEQASEKLMQLKR